MGMNNYWILLVSSLLPSSLAHSAAVDKLLARNDVLYERIRNSFSFDILEETIEPQVKLLPIELNTENGEVYSCSLSDVDDETSSEIAANDRSKDIPVVQKVEESKLSALDGKCETLNTGWWSYQWCHRLQVKQFHVDVTKGIIDTEWSLGSYDTTTKSNNLNIQEKNGHNYEEDDEDDEEEEDPLDYFIDGQHCDETGQGRQTKVEFRCCHGEDINNKHKKKNKKSSSGSSLVSFLSITENEICSYEVVICTSLMCATNQNDVSMNNVNSNSKLTKDDSAIVLLSSLQKGSCLTRHEGWWSYEYCYQHHIRQFHVNSGTDADGKTVSKVEGEFKLGEAPPDITNEAQLVKHEAKYTIAPPIDEPDGPYSIELQYGDGTPCDLVNTPRSTTVKFVCGNTNSILSVVEDRTCHYLMVISSSQLCKHPSFVQRRPPSRPIKCEKVEQQSGSSRKEETYASPEN